MTPATLQTDRIHILPSELINQIAAGEVVERPSSVVKELVENSIDAGATSIEITLVNGGRDLIEVSDDGCGMSESDAQMSIRRHATSKISRFEDLLSVATLGFRGEALPSIASVSRFTLLSFDGLAPHALELEWPGEGEPIVRPAARTRGTTVRVADLFANVPARRKFLKSADAEFRSIIGVVTSYALSVPKKSFRLTHNRRVMLDFPSAGSLRERLLQILGADVESHLAEISMTLQGCIATGFVTRGLRYGTRRNQFFFVNRRLVRDRVITHAATRASEAFDFDGQPAIVIFLEVDPTTVDVNVHPAKTEVRFRDSGLIHVAVEQGIRTALGGAQNGAALIREPIPAMTTDDEVRNGAHDALNSITPVEVPLPSPDRRIPYELTPLFSQRPVVQPPSATGQSLGDLQGKVIGQYRDSYIIVDSPEGLRLVDQHVAHERVLYDRIEKTMSVTDVQRLLEPFVYETGAAEAGILDSLGDELRALGFEIERFSGNSFAVAAVPAMLSRENLGRFFRNAVEAALEERGSPAQRVREKIIASLACQAAIKVHRPLSGAEMSGLVADLLGTTNPFACPHGRPIIVDIRHFDIEKHFHRR